MPNVIGQSEVPNQPGVLGQALPVPIPESTAIGVKGDGGPGFPELVAPGRRAIGVYGTTSDPNGVGVQGENTGGGNAGQFDGALQVNGNATVTGNLQNKGALLVIGPATVRGNSEFAGDALFEKSVEVEGSLGCAGGCGFVEVLVERTVTVRGDVVLTNQDCAEDFDIGLCTNVEPGTVMALDERGLLQESRHAYDKKVAGVISGAGEFKPGLILGREKGQSDSHRVAVALMGKVYCKVDAQFGEIGVGDLLTTSDTPGHAMRADDPLKAFGSVIGKALQSLSAGQKGLIPILVALQ
jgi:hypothetical protein